MHGTCKTHLLNYSLAPVIGSCYAAIVLERHMQRLALIWRLSACIALLHHHCTGSAASPSPIPLSKGRWLTVLHRLIRQAGQVHCGADDGTILYHPFRQALPQVQETKIDGFSNASLM